MNTRIEVSFEVERWDEQPIDDAVPKLTRASVGKRFIAGIDGSSTTEYVMAYREDGTATFVGLERFTGRVDGRSGTLVLSHIGSFVEGAARARLEVVGSDGLGGVSGGGDFLADPSGSMTLELEFS